MAEELDEDVIMDAEAISLEDSEDTAKTDIPVSNAVKFVYDRFKRAYDFRYQDEQRWLSSYRNS